MPLSKQYTDFSELTPAMINEFVEKILVHQAEGKGASRTQEVEIFFNFIGKVEIPRKEIELTEEEKAAISGTGTTTGRRKPSITAAIWRRSADNGKSNRNGRQEQQEALSSLPACFQPRKEQRSSMRILIDNGNTPAKPTRPYIGHYGQLRKAYLERLPPRPLHRPCRKREPCYEHCAEIDAAARRRLDLIIPQLAKERGSYRGTESRRPHAMGGADERLQGASGRNRQV